MLDEADILALLSEALSADVHAILSDETRAVVADSAVEGIVSIILSTTVGLNSNAWVSAIRNRRTGETVALQSSVSFACSSTFALDCAHTGPASPSSSFPHRSRPMLIFTKREQSRPTKIERPFQSFVVWSTRQIRET